MARPSKRTVAKTAAILTIHKPGKMTYLGRKGIAEWLEIQALNLRTLGDEYTTGRFTARYLYR